MSQHETREVTGDARFEEPWQVHALAIAEALKEAGVIPAGEWAAALGRERAKPGTATDGSDYYAGVVAALEAVLAARGLVGPGQVDGLAAAWSRAAHATPHGRPVLLENDPQRP